MPTYTVTFDIETDSSLPAVVTDELEETFPDAAVGNVNVYDSTATLLVPVKTQTQAVAVARTELPQTVLDDGCPECGETNAFDATVVRRSREWYDITDGTLDHYGDTPAGPDVIGYMSFVCSECHTYLIEDGETTDAV